MGTMETLRLMRKKCFRCDRESEFLDDRGICVLCRSAERRSFGTEVMITKSDVNTVRGTREE